jgi:type III pantothenate kinase
VDCGTAITVDVLNQHGQHLGGLISPGLQTMKHSLFKGTEDLSHVDQQYPVGLANFTESAIYSGTLFAAIGLIEKVATDLCNYQTIVLTGGDAELLAQQLEFEVIVEPYFILKGLSLYCLGEVLR